MCFLPFSLSLSLSLLRFRFRMYIDRSLSQSNSMQEQPWGDYDDSGCCQGPFCFNCCGNLTRLRPTQDKEQVQDCYLHPKTDSDHKLVDDMEKMKDVADDEDVIGQFYPQSEVDRTKSYSFDVFQDFGLLTEAEFTKLCKTTPQAAGLNKKNAPNIRLSFNGPEGKQKYFLGGLQGLPCSEVHGMRKIRMRMTDSVP